VTGADEWPFGGGLADMAMRARLLIAMADGAEEAGFVMSSRRSRQVARDLLELVERVRAYESALESVLDEREREAPATPAGALPADKEIEF
jgi:hypothetical protein